jgi:flagellar hook-associated protein 3 FlgL
MRISTTQIYSQGLSLMLQKQAQLSRYQEQIATGKKLLSPADDPAGAAQVLDLSHVIEVTDQFNRNGDMATQRLQHEEAVLDNATQAVQRVRELIMQSRGAATDNDRKFIAAEIRQRFQELVSLANTIDGNGDYLFAGNKVRTRPFSVNTVTGAVTYLGDQGVRQIQVSPTRSLADADNGEAVFMAIRNGNGTYVTIADAANTGTGVIDPGSLANPAAFVPDSFRIVFTSATTFDVIDDTTATTVLAAQTYTDGAPIAFNGLTVSIAGVPATGDQFRVQPSANQSIFTTIDNIADMMETQLTTPALKARYTNAVNRALTDIDQTLERFLEVRATVGARLNGIDAQRLSNDDLKLQLTKQRSGLEDVDIVEAASNLNLNLTTLQASQAAFARMQDLSLFNFIR